MPVTPARPTTPSKAGITRNADGQQIIPASLRPDGTTRREIKVRPGYRPPEDVEVYKNRTAEAWKSRGSGGVPGAGSASDSDRKDAAANNKNAKRRAARKKAKEKDGERDDDDEDADTEVKGVKQAKGVKEAKEPKEPKEVEVKEVGMNKVEEIKVADKVKSSKEVKEVKEVETGAKTEGKAEVAVEVKKGDSLPSTDTNSHAALPEPKSEQTQEEKEKQAKSIRKKIRQANELKNRKEAGENLLPEQLEKVSKLDGLVSQLNSLGFE